jgi:hypothetical protein
MASHGLDLGDFRVSRGVAIGALRELEQVDHRLQRILDALVDGADEAFVDEEADER